MKRLFKRLLAGLGILVAVGLVFVVVRFYAFFPKVNAAPDVKAPDDPATIARGEYLVKNVCSCLNCHSDADDGEPGQPIAPGAPLGAGRHFAAAHGFPTATGGDAYAPNMTSSKTYGFGGLTDGEILRAMREGIGHDGRPLFLLMPYQSYRDLTDDDALAIIAYIRTLPAVEKDAPRSTTLKFPASMVMRSVPLPVEKPASPPPPNDQLARGNYLLKIALCHNCHDTQDRIHRPLEGMELAGGTPYHFSKGTAIPANISSDQATGIGAYSDEDILRAITQGKTRNGRSIYLMSWQNYANMTDADKKAIVAALRAAPPQSHVVPPSDVR